MLFALNFRFILCNKKDRNAFLFSVCVWGGGEVYSELSCFEISNCMMDVKCIENCGDLLYTKAN